MDHHQFEDEVRDPVELKSKIKRVSYLKISKNILVNFCQGLIMFYTQYLLFYRKSSNEADYRCSVVTVFISALVSFIFARRIIIINKQDDFVTMFVITFIVLILNSYCFSIFGFGGDVTWFKIILTYIFIPLYLLLQIPPFLLQIFTTKYAIQCKMAERKGDKDIVKFYELMIRASADADFINNFECYLRAAPQQIVLMAVFFYNHGDFSKVSVLQQASILCAFFIMPWTNTMFKGSFYKMQYKEVPLKTKVIYYSGVFCLTIARLTSIAEAIAFWPVVTAAIMLIHWTVAVTWFWWSTKPTEFFNHSKFWHVFLSLVFGWVYIFTPINLIEGPTRKQYIWFYGITFVQNAAASAVWFVGENERPLEYKITVICLNFLTFVFGLGLIIWYYKKCHPNKLTLDEDCDDEDFLEDDTVIDKIPV